MSLRLRLVTLCMALFALLAFANGCGNSGCTDDGACGGQFCVNGACVQCRADSNCNANNKCMQCQNYSCVAVNDCCTTDAECGSGQRCWNESGRAWGKCGAK